MPEHSPSYRCSPLLSRVVVPWFHHPGAYSEITANARRPLVRGDDGQTLSLRSEDLSRIWPQPNCPPMCNYCQIYYCIDFICNCRLLGNTCCRIK